MVVPHASSNPVPQLQNPTHARTSRVKTTEMKKQQHTTSQAKISAPVTHLQNDIHAKITRAKERHNTEVEKGKERKEQHDTKYNKTSCSIDDKLDLNSDVLEDQHEPKHLMNSSVSSASTDPDGHISEKYNRNINNHF